MQISTRARHETQQRSRGDTLTRRHSVALTSKCCWKKRDASRTHAHTHALLSDPARLTVKIHLRAPIHAGAPRCSEPICVDDYEYFSQPPPIIIMHGSDDLDWPSPLISNCKTPPFDAACLFQSCLVRFRFFNAPQHFTRLEFFLVCVQREGGPSALPFAQQLCWRFCNAARGIYVHSHCVLLIFNLLNSLSPLRGCWHSNGGK